MIRLPNLDDQTYDDIVETAGRRVMQYYPEWTNFNPSDPGLTILELFAWLKEMQQYQLNRITRDGILACLRLLGLSPKKAAPAVVTAALQSKTPCTIASGHPFITEDGMVFETCKSVKAGGVSVSAVWVDGGGSDGLRAAVHNRELAIEPFGPEEKEGACLYIGFSGPMTPELRLYFEIYDGYPIARTPFGEETEPSREIAWEYGAEFRPMTGINDMTRGFSVSGEVTLMTDGEWNASKPAPDMPEHYWIRARLKRRGAEENPKIIRFFKDYITLHQRETLSCAADVTAENGVLTLADHTGINGDHTVFAAGQDGWKHVPITNMRRFDDRAEISADVMGNCRVVAVKPGFNALLSTETNLPGISLKIPAPGFFEKLKLMIEEGGIWRDWEYLEQLHTAGPHDRVFSTDTKSGSVIFGDNLNGACPPAGINNVLISECRVTRGAEGNILPHKLTASQSGESGPVPDNITAGAGGRDDERLEETLARISQLLTASNCVTRADYEKAAFDTPGARILKVRAIEGYDPKTGGMNIPALVTVVIQPYSFSERPMPDAGMLKRVRRRLEDGRLLATRVEVAAPEYIPVSVRVDAVAGEGSAAAANVRESLLRFLSPVEGALGIGQPVLVTDITATVVKCAGITRVTGVTLNVPSTAAAIDRSGNIVLPPHAIPYAGEIEVNIS